ncbi:hypothetical protein E3N88_42067 [Mikania micrantha]|uniref:Uncharacterized protein n=1 Tax=Mikania micrantha TaxID=192012 RepID=A0A5N6LIV6_9ASTR|nr:hypothetical protein E3N88_42067 [Mikania micrantha]
MAQVHRNSDKSFSYRQDSSRSPTPFKQVFSSSSSNSSNVSRDRGVRSLSRTEWQDRRKKGLCYRCGQQYGPAHKCPKGKLRILLLGEDEDDSGEGEHQLLELEAPLSTPTPPLTGSEARKRPGNQLRKHSGSGNAGETYPHAGSVSVQDPACAISNVSSIDYILIDDNLIGKWVVTRRELNGGLLVLPFCHIEDSAIVL